MPIGMLLDQSLQPRQLIAREPAALDASVIPEGTIKLPASQESQPVGLFLAQGKDSGAAILVHAGGLTEFGPMRADGTGFKAEQRVDREWKSGAAARFRLLLRDSLIEFYLDDLLIQCYRLPQKPTGPLGILAAGDPNAVTTLKAWRPGELQP